MISGEDELFHMLQDCWLSFVFSTIYIMPESFWKVPSKQVSVTEVIN